MKSKLVAYVSSLIGFLPLATCSANDSLFEEPGWTRGQRVPSLGRGAGFRRGNSKGSLFDNKNFMSNDTGLSKKGRSNLDFSDVDREAALKSQGKQSPSARANVMRMGGNSTIKMRNGGSMQIGQDGTRTFMNKNGMQSMLNPDGTGALPNGGSISKDAVAGSTTMKTKQGYGFTSKSDGSKTFTRTNGIETVFKPGKAPVMQTQDGHVVQEIK